MAEIDPYADEECEIRANKGMVEVIESFGRLQNFSVTKS